MFRHQTTAKPFIHRDGGKRSLASLISSYFENLKYDCYYESFLGGGAVFFALQPHKAYLADNCPELITCYQAVKNDVEGVIKQLHIYHSNYNKEHLWATGQAYLTEINPVIQTAMYIYLNRISMNGKWFYNKEGKFKTYPKNNISNFQVPEDNLRAVNQVLQDVIIKNQSYTETPIEPNCLYYLDPPYHQAANFYNSPFTEEDQKRLKYFCNTINEIGSKFVLSNSNTDFIKDLYKEYRTHSVEVIANLSFQGAVNKRRTELLITNIKEN